MTGREHRTREEAYAEVERLRAAYRGGGTGQRVVRVYRGRDLVELVDFHREAALDSQSQLAGEHQPGRTRADDDDVLGRVRGTGTARYTVSRGLPEDAGVDVMRSSVRGTRVRAHHPWPLPPGVLPRVYLDPHRLDLPPSVQPPTPSRSQDDQKRVLAGPRTPAPGAAERVAVSPA